MELTHSEKQFILYTKGWYKKSDNRMDDIKVIIGKAYGLYPEQVEMYSVVHFVTDLFDRLTQNGNIPTEGYTPTYFMLNNIFKYNLQRDDETLFYFIYNRIQGCNVINLELGDTDSEYLQPNGERKIFK
ncbi:hypothetical protein [Psychrobacillus phage Perkons]|nr:hypothetical protein [Psychrobacillus phage Perkons]